MQDMRKILDRISAQKPERGAVASSKPTSGAVNVPDAMPKEVPGVMPAAPGAPAPLPPLAPEGAVVPPPQIISGGPVEQASFNKLVQMDPRILVNKIASLQSELERLPLVINDGKRRLAVLQQKLDAVKDTPVSPFTLEAVEKDQDVIVQNLKAKQAQREYEFRAGAGDPKAPGVVQLKQAWDAHEAKLKEIKKEKADAIERTRRVADAQKIAAEMDDLIRFLQRQQEQLDVAKALLGRAEKQLAELPLPTNTNKNGELLQAGAQEPVGYQPEGSYTDSADGIYRRLVQQYYLTQMELSSPTRVRVLQQGSNPTQRDMKKQIMGTVFAAFMGFGFMILGVLGFEMLTKRVSSLADVKAAGPMPVVGVIPGSPGEAVGRDPVKRAAANEAIDKLRTHVAQTWLARGATTIAVTSPLDDEGKAFTAFGLASSLAQSGYRTLLVDFDLRCPQLHDFAGTANNAGVCELLRGELEAAAILQYLPSGLHLLPAGKWSDEARKAATGERLATMLSKLQAPYDCVVMHGHALLTAAESVEVARRCEVVLVCAQYRATTAPLLKRAADRVASMEVPYSGVVYVGATTEEAIC
jgi:Mrp family chromosome partitioning ATPase